MTQAGERLIRSAKDARQHLRSAYPLLFDHAVVGHKTIGHWLSAALDDPLVCDEMKTDISLWFESQDRALRAATLRDDWHELEELK